MHSSARRYWRLIAIPALLLGISRFDHERKQTGTSVARVQGMLVEIIERANSRIELHRVHEEVCAAIAVSRSSRYDCDQKTVAALQREIHRKSRKSVTGGDGRLANRTRQSDKFAGTISLISLTASELREIKLSDLRDCEIERCRDESLTAKIIARSCVPQ